MKSPNLFKDARYWIYYHPEQVIKILWGGIVNNREGLGIIAYFVLIFLFSPVIFIAGGVEAIYDGIRAKRLPFNFLFGKHCGSC